jgi:hypothetical protein
MSKPVLILGCHRQRLADGGPDWSEYAAFVGYDDCGGNRFPMVASTGSVCRPGLGKLRSQRLD